MNIKTREGVNKRLQEDYPFLRKIVRKISSTITVERADIKLLKREAGFLGDYCSITGSRYFTFLSKDGTVIFQFGPKSPSFFYGFFYSIIRLFWKEPETVADALAATGDDIDKIAFIVQAEIGFGHHGYVLYKHNKDRTFRELAEDLENEIESEISKTCGELSKV